MERKEVGAGFIGASSCDAFSELLESSFNYVYVLCNGAVARRSLNLVVKPMSRQLSQSSQRFHLWPVFWRSVLEFDDFRTWDVLASILVTDLFLAMLRLGCFVGP